MEHGTVTDRWGLDDVFFLFVWRGWVFLFLGGEAREGKGNGEILKRGGRRWFGVFWEYRIFFLKGVKGLFE